MKSKQGGFTFIELIVVIIILSILAATAIPRYIALQTQARIAKLNGALGAVKGAAALTHGACLATPTCTSAAVNLSAEGVNISMINQYPTANATGIVSAAGLTISAAEGYATTGGGGAAGNTITIQVLGNVPATCSFTYAAPTGVGLAPVFGAAATAGC